MTLKENSLVPFELHLSPHIFKMLNVGGDSSDANDGVAGLLVYRSSSAYLTAQKNLMM